MTNHFLKAKNANGKIIAINKLMVIEIEEHSSPGKTTLRTSIGAITIKKSIDDTIKMINKYLDKHIKPIVYTDSSEKKKNDFINTMANMMSNRNQNV